MNKMKGLPGRIAGRSLVRVGQIDETRSARVFVLWRMVMSRTRQKEGSRHSAGMKHGLMQHEGQGRTGTTGQSNGDEARDLGPRVDRRGELTGANGFLLNAKCRCLA